jgi:hypothetical protein
MSIQISQKDFTKIKQEPINREQPSPELEIEEIEKEQLPKKLKTKIIKIGNLKFTPNRWKQKQKEINQWKKDHWLLDKIIIFYLGIKHKGFDKRNIIL